MSRKGIPNKDKTLLLRALQKIHTGYNPLTELLNLAHSDTTTANEKITCHKEIAQYVNPKLKAVEHSGNIDAEVTYKPIIKRFDGSMDEPGKDNAS